MKLWLITVGESLPLSGAPSKLLRTGRLARYLGGQGHEVIWWSSTFDHVRKVHHFQEGRDLPWEERVSIRLLHAPRYDANVSLARLNHQRVTAAEFLRRASGMSPPDVILCSYPTIELSRAAVAFARHAACKVVLDVRDLWPDLFVTGLPRPLRPLAQPVIAAFDRMGRAALRAADGIVAVSSGYLAWALEKAGRPASPERDAVLPIGYALPSLSDVELLNARRRLSERGVSFGKHLAVFVGSFGSTYDLSTVIRAARSVESELPNVQFVLAGAGDRERLWRAEAAGVTNVIMPGWLDASESAALCGAACIGLQSYAPGAPQGLANKLFEYLAYGLALVSSLEGENAALITEQGCGVNYAAGSAHDLRARLLELVRSPGLLERTRARARSLFEREYDQRLIHGRFLRYLSGVGESRTR